MLRSLCGHYPCPRICVRVCHCPAGLARSRELLGMYRNRRLVLRSGLRPQGGLPPERWPEVEVISEARSYPRLPDGRIIDPETGRISEAREALRRLRSRVMTRANYYHYHANLTRSQACRLSWAEWKQVKVPATHNFGVLNQPQRKKSSRFCPTHFEPKSSLPYTRLLKPWLAPVFASVILAIISLVVLLGGIASDWNFAPGYEPPVIHTWESR